MTAGKDIFPRKKDCRVSTSSPFLLFFNTLSDRLAISDPAFLFCLNAYLIYQYSLLVYCIFTSKGRVTSVNYNSPLTTIKIPG